jgi:DNA-binding MarR family transcriptional regulator
MVFNPFDTINQPLEQRLITGLYKLGLALRHQAWQGAESQGLTPTQGQILAVLQLRSRDAIRLSEVAESLAVSAATASDAVGALVKKGLVTRTQATDDRRAVALRLTPEGELQAAQAAKWPDFLLTAVDELSPDEQLIFFRGLTKIIFRLQQQDRIPLARMCLTCEYFREDVYDDRARPHHCQLVNAPLGELDFRLDCPEHLS